MHLDITLTQSLRWSKHIDDLSTKCFKMLDLMKALKRTVGRCFSLEATLIYLVPSFQHWTMVTSYIQLFAWTYNSILCKLDRIQVTAMRIVTSAIAWSNIKLPCEETAWADLFTHHSQHVLCLFYKIVNGMSLTASTDVYNSFTTYNQPYNL